jgi:hypothetical protein
MAIRRMTGLIKWPLIAGFLLLSGCSSVAPPEDEPVSLAPPENSPVSLALRFKPDQQSTFRATHETARSVEWMGVTPSDGKEFRGGATGQTSVIVFDEKVLSVDPNGEAALEITIKELKFKAIMQDKELVDYDSTQSPSSDTALAALKGQRYVIHMTPTGQVTSSINARAARTALDKKAAQYQMALKLLTDRAIQKRHTLKSLLETPPAPLAPGQTWSVPQTFSFSMMGKRTFTKNYTYKGVEGQGDTRIARVEMNGVPSVSAPQQDDEGGSFLKMFDNTHQYSGHLDLDVTRGRVRTWTEDMEIKWAYLDASSVDKEGQEEPKSVHMTALENIGLECLN